MTCLVKTAALSVLRAGIGKVGNVEDVCADFGIPGGGGSTVIIGHHPSTRRPYYC